jgi:hypothetical protein
MKEGLMADNGFTSGELIARITSNALAVDDRLEQMRQQKPRDLYAEARVFGEAQAGWCGFDALYWAAWYAARQTATALLEAHAEFQPRTRSVREQWEALRIVASEVAYD